MNIIKSSIGIVVVCFISSCCKVESNFIAISRVYFKSFILSEVDTFYALPHIVDSVLPWSEYTQYQETAQDLHILLTTNELRPFNSIEIVLKDTSKRYVVSVVKTQVQVLGPGRCSPADISIVQFTVNDSIQTGDTIIIIP